MFVLLTMSSHSNANYGIKTGNGPCVLRVTDVRHVGAWIRVYSNVDTSDHCIVTTLDGAKYAVRDQPADIYAMLGAAMPKHRSVNDHAILGAIEVSGAVSVQHEVAGHVEHVTINA